MVCLVQHDGAVHLAGKSNAGNLIGVQSRAGHGLPHRDPTGPPPVFRILLRPANLRRSERSVLLGGGRQYPASLIHNQGPGAAGADIDSENMCWHLCLAVYVNGRR